MTNLLTRFLVLSSSIVAVSAWSSVRLPGARRAIPRISHFKLPASIAGTTTSLVDNNPSESDYWIDREKLKYTIFKVGKGAKQKVLNLHGLWVVAASLATMPIWIAALSLEQLYMQINKKWDKNRAIFDKTGKIWAKTWLKLISSYPTQSGNVDLLKTDSIGPCLYVANHGSWLDIPIVCTVLQPVFKFIAKGDLKNIPGIGQQLRGGKHIILDREDKRSQLKTFKDGIGWLKKGVPLMAFPEGKRSTQQGRLMEFKGGLFSMAIKTGVPVVPISLSHTHAIFPPYGLLPVQSGRGKLHVHVHEPIDSQGKTEQELSELVRQAFCDQLPECQLPMEVADDDDDMTAMAP
mmetsp:Transcript_2243/g.4925  ORF Transcript_2243/g.4925 Transcript_2243/m.4925 type:complete len:349 (-) Transcript_2243:2335-3381(-)